MKQILNVGLCLILTFVADISSADELAENNIAQVYSTEAVIYADKELQNPIGKVSKNKLFSVGQRLHTNPGVVPIVVSGKFAYIKTSDISISSDLKVNFHDPDLSLENPPEKFLENNSFYFAFQRLEAGSELRTVFNNLDHISQSQLSGFNIALLHHQSGARLIWGVGFDYYSINSSNINYSFYLFKPSMGGTAYKNNLINLELLFSLNIATGSLFTIKRDIYTEDVKNTGFIYGADICARLIFFPRSKFHFTSSLAYQKLGTYNGQNFTDFQNIVYSPIQQIGGINYAIGFSIDI
jgi:hypothetical protein